MISSTKDVYRLEQVENDGGMKRTDYDVGTEAIDSDDLENPAYG